MNRCTLVRNDMHTHDDDKQSASWLKFLDKLRPGARAVLAQDPGASPLTEPDPGALIGS